MRHALSTLLVTLFVTPAVFAQDREFIRAVERAQADRPASLSSAARIAPPEEPGVPLVIHGRAFREDGRTPLADAIVFAYHTDREGLYDRAGSPPHSWRLRGWARTDAEGRFSFSTIRPGPYPANRIAAHVHFTLFTSDARYYAGELQFDDDRFLTARERTASDAAGDFGSVRSVRRDGGTEHVELNLKVDPGQRF